MRRWSDFRSALAESARLAVAFVGGWLAGLVVHRRRRPPAQVTASAAEQGDAGLYRRVPAWQQYERDCPRVRGRWKRLLLGDDEPPVPSYPDVIEDPPKAGEAPKIGICCSGGGIRSAAFNLGALQEVQENGRLHEAKYLSAVSGGSYIAAGFSMVARTPKPGTTDGDDSDPTLFTEGRMPSTAARPRSSTCATAARTWRRAEWGWRGSSTGSRWGCSRT
jgi:hypothetical protein